MIFAVPSRSPDGHLANFVTIDLHEPSKTENASSKYSINHFPPFSINAAGLFPSALLNMREKYSGSEKTAHFGYFLYRHLATVYIEQLFRVFDALGKKKLKGHFAVSVPKKPPNVIFVVTYFFNFFGQVKARIPQIVHKVVVERRYHAVFALTHKRHDKLQIGA